MFLTPRKQSMKSAGSPQGAFKGVQEYQKTPAAAGRGSQREDRANYEWAAPRMWHFGRLNPTCCGAPIDPQLGWPSAVDLRGRILLMARVLMNFDYYKALWWVHFIEAHCKTPIGTKTRYYHFATLDGLRAFAQRCTPENMAEFEPSVRTWGGGSNYVNLTPEQYAKLK